MNNGGSSLCVFKIIMERNVNSNLLFWQKYFCFVFVIIFGRIKTLQKQSVIFLVGVTEKEVDRLNKSLIELRKGHLFRPNWWGRVGPTPVLVYEKVTQRCYARRVYIGCLMIAQWTKGRISEQLRSRMSRNLNLVPSLSYLWTIVLIHLLVVKCRRCWKRSILWNLNFHDNMFL